MIVRIARVKVGHCQASIKKGDLEIDLPFLLLPPENLSIEVGSAVERCRLDFHDGVHQLRSRGEAILRTLGHHSAKQRLKAG